MTYRITVGILAQHWYQEQPQPQTGDTVRDMLHKLVGRPTFPVMRTFESNRTDPEKAEIREKCNIPDRVLDENVHIYMVETPLEES